MYGYNIEKWYVSHFGEFKGYLYHDKGMCKGEKEGLIPR